MKNTLTFPRVPIDQDDLTAKVLQVFEENLPRQVIGFPLPPLMRVNSLLDAMASVNCEGRLRKKHQKSRTITQLIPIGTLEVDVLTYDENGVHLYARFQGQGTELLVRYENRVSHFQREIRSYDVMARSQGYRIYENDNPNRLEEFFASLGQKITRDEYAHREFSDRLNMVRGYGANVKKGIEANIAAAEKLTEDVEFIKTDQKPNVISNSVMAYWDQPGILGIDLIFGHEMVSYIQNGPEMLPPILMGLSDSALWARATICLIKHEAMKRDASAIFQYEGFYYAMKMVN